MGDSLIHLGPEQFAEFVNLSADVVFQTDASGRITFVNPASEGIIGQPPGDLIGSHYLYLVSPEVRNSAYRFYSEQVRRRTERTYYEYPAVTRDGRTVWLGQHVQLLQENGVLTGFHAVAHDVSDRHVAERDSRNRADRMRLLHEITTSTQGSSDAQIRSALSEAARLLGLDLAAVSRVAGDQYTVAHYWPDDAGLQQGQTFELSSTYCELTIESGSVVAIGHAGISEYKAHPCYDAFGIESYIGSVVRVGGNIVGTLNLSSTTPREDPFTDADVDFVALLAQWIGAMLERQHAQQSVQESEERLRAVVEGAADGVITCDESGVVLSVNPAAKSILASTRHEVVGEDVRLFLPELMSLVRESDGDETIATDRSTPGLRVDGQSFDAEVSISRTRTRRRAMLVVLLRDVSMRRKQELQVAQREATLRAFYDGAPFLMGVLRMKDGRVEHLSANSAAIEFFGLVHSNSLSSGSVGVPGRLPGATRWESACRQSQLSGGPVKFEARYGDAWLRATVNMIDDRRDADPRFSYVVEDISALRSQESDLSRRRAEFEAIYDSIPSAVVFADTHGRIQMVNPAFTRIFGYPAEEAEGQPIRMIYASDEDFERVGEARLGDQSAPEAATFETRCRRRDGEVFLGETVGVRVVDNDGQLLGHLGIIQDVTREKATEERIKFQADVLAHVHDAIVVMDHEMKITYWNRGAERIIGFNAEEATGRSVLRIARYRWLTTTEEHTSIQSLLNEGSWTGKMRIQTREGQERFIDAVVSLMRAPDGEPTGILVVARDVTAKVELEGQLRMQARSDTLTGLPNRAVLDERLQEAITNRTRSGAGFAVLFIDLDRFKLVNDSLGHAVGDGLLVEIASRICSVVRPEDLVARIGGDEFAVLLEDAPGTALAETIAQRLQRALSKSITVGGRPQQGSASIGIVVSDDRYTDPQTILRDADTAMYEAKRKGRGSFVVFSQRMHEIVARRFRLESDLPFAAQRGELVCLYQPIVDLKTGATAGFEALVRWDHPEFGRLGPDEFLPLAGDIGCLEEIDTWVLGEASARLATWLDHFGITSGLTVNVNCSSQTVLSDRYREMVEKTVRQYGLPADALGIEITEQLLILDVELASRQMNAMRDSGVTILVDDFGTGYSSLSLLHALPVQAVKTDRSLLAEAEDNERSRSILSTVAELSDALKLRLVAEGIERMGQLERVREFGYGFGQGYLFSRPVEADEAMALVRSGPWQQIWKSGDTEAA